MTYYIECSKVAYAQLINEALCVLKYLGWNWKIGVEVVKKYILETNMMVSLFGFSREP